jgi:hypothetical protein
MVMAKQAYCGWCGEPVDAAAWERFPTCGARECERAAREEEIGEREEAHGQLDRDMGWDR